jgi:putative flippase GtrA
MKTKRKKSLLKLLTEFAKLQLAGNIPFWGTYLGFMLFDKALGWEEFYALATATILANILFFIVDDKWVFANEKGKRKSSYEILKFIIFMSFSASLVFGITTLLSYFGISPYIGQFISATLSTAWVFLGLRFWVFSPPHHHGLIAVKRKTRFKKRAA